MCVVDGWCSSSHSRYSLHQGRPHVTSSSPIFEASAISSCAQPNRGPVTHFILFASLSITRVRARVCLLSLANSHALVFSPLSTQSKGGILLVCCPYFFDLLPVHDLLLIEASVDRLGLAASHLACKMWW
jgi:hypothetical protein